MRRTTGTITAGLLIAAAALSSGTALAAPGKARGNAGTHQSQHDRIVHYWTAERRASAIPRDIRLPSARTKGGKPGRPGGGGGDGGDTGGDASGVVTGATWLDSNAAVAKTTGKVFFTMGGVRYVCSGSAISGEVDMVLTAGHCVWDDTDEFATTWTFWPDYYAGMPETEAWSATSLFTTQGWHDTDGRDFPNDAGIAVVTGPTGATLGDALPSMGFSTATDTFSAFGYPAAKKYKGATLTYCQGPGTQETGRDAGAVSIACDMTGGSSGGPWYDMLNGTGDITSLNSYGYSGLNRMFGPTFDMDQESPLLGAAKDGKCDASEHCEDLAG